MIYYVILIRGCNSMSCVMCESDGVQLRPAVDVLVVPYSVIISVASLTLYGTTST